MDARQQHPHFTTHGAAARLREGIPGVIVEVDANDSNVWVSAVFAAPDYLSALRKVRSLLLNGVDVDPWPDVHLRWAPDQRAWTLAVIRDDVIEALGLRSRRGADLGHIVKVWVDRFTLRIHVDTAGLFNHASATRNSWASMKNEWFRKVAGVSMKLPKGVSQVEVQIGDPEFDFAPMPFASADVADDFDDDSDGDGDGGKNPNWPSRTGNPSGGGRGNNPPRRSRPGVRRLKFVSGYI